MNKHTVAVLGASGYSGAELLRYIAGHPDLHLAWATADSNAGKTVGEVFGHLSDVADVILQPTDPASVPDVDLAFLALPHGSAASHGRTLVQRGVKVVDLSADWRLHDASAYPHWYGASHPHPDELGTWVYGLTEFHRDAIRDSSAVANPGCYPSAALLALVPLLRDDVISSEGIVIDAVSGVSGAGRKIDAAYLYTELEGSFGAYRVGKHQHTPEIEQELGDGVTVVFTPHLAPMTRGLLATCYARATGSADAVRESLERAYKGEPFVGVLGAGSQPQTKHVSGTNRAVIAAEVDARTQTAIITCAIDNLGKGAAGQAVQNANVMLGLDETAGLGAMGVFP
jgi:N-acetyl-gamma-glutamyl-phosphate reductase